jgi:hypothetical protein
MDQAIGTKKKDSDLKHFIYIFLLLPLFSVWAGPPFRTDDPEPVEYHHGECYLGSLITCDNKGVSGSAPQVEINFGAFHDMQVHCIIPIAFNKPKIGTFTYGPGDVELGLKYRLVNETSLIPQVGIFPLIEIPTGNAKRQLGAGTMQLFLPLWLQKSWGAWTTYGGGGYLVNITSNPANSWFMGWEGQRDFSSFISIGAEVFSTIVPSESSDNEIAFNAGAIMNFSDNHHFLFSAGRDIVGHSRLILYAAYQLTI